LRGARAGALSGKETEIWTWTRAERDWKRESNIDRATGGDTNRDMNSDTAWDTDRNTDWTVTNRRDSILVYK
jgi:hypothetical protein